MPRQPRVVAVGVPHHITQRGNFRQTVFSTDADRLFYLETLRRKCLDHGHYSVSSGPGLGISVNQDVSVKKYNAAEIMLS